MIQENKRNNDYIKLLETELKVVENDLKIEDFITLRNQANFIKYKKEDVEIALKNTLYSITIYKNNNPIAIARVVGDGRIAFFIKDVVVDFRYKGLHLGKRLMQGIFNYLDKNACINAYVGLMATPNTEGFYEKFGFIRRPNENHGAGMIMYYRGGNTNEEDSSIW